jgi:hypothetical protein
MEFWASAEVDAPAGKSSDIIRRLVEPVLNASLSRSNLSAVPGELQYIPIIMPDDMHRRYPERSRLKKKQRIYVCAPHLNFSIFVEGTFEEQLREYLRGIGLSTHRLEGLGASSEQMKEFKQILASAADQILEEFQKPN